MLNSNTIPLGTPQGGGVRPESRKSKAGCLAGGNVSETWAWAVGQNWAAAATATISSSRRNLSILQKRENEQWERKKEEEK